MASFLIAFFLCVLCVGVGSLLWAVHDLRESIKAPKLTMVPRETSNGTDAVTAQIPPSVTTYEPVYLSDGQIAAKLRGKGTDSTAPKVHEPIEASRV